MSLDGEENDSQHSVNSTHALIPSTSNHENHPTLSPILEMSFRMASSAELSSMLKNAEDGLELHPFDSMMDPDEEELDGIVTDENSVPSNERLLGIAFLTFSSFAITQMIFAFIAGSQAMMGDSAAMLVDSITYLFNYIAERKKHHFDTAASVALQQQQEDPEDPIKAERIRKRNRRKMVLQLEILPPTISVSTLVIVTIYVTTKAIRLLRLDMHRSRSEQHRPNVNLMLAFSVCNLVLDGLNVFCFARAKHLMGYSTTANPTVKTSQKDDDDFHGTPFSDEPVANVADPDPDANQGLSHVCDTTHPRADDGNGSEDANCVTASVQRKGYSQVPSCQNANGSHMEAVSDAATVTADNCSYPNDSGPEHSIPNQPRRKLSQSPPSRERHHHHHHHGGNDDDDDDTNLNMCSAYTHVFADTLRSVAVIVAAVLAEVLPNVTPEVADATAAVLVSFLILLSLVPLIQGLMSSISELRAILREERSDMAFYIPSSSTMDHFEMT